MNTVHREADELYCPVTRCNFANACQDKLNERIKKKHPQSGGNRGALLASEDEPATAPLEPPSPNIRRSTRIKEKPSSEIVDSNSLEVDQVQQMKRDLRATEREASRLRLNISQLQEEIIRPREEKKKREVAQFTKEKNHLYDIISMLKEQRSTNS
jgi:TolA-binding protein